MKDHTSVHLFTLQKMTTKSRFIRWEQMLVLTEGRGVCQNVALTKDADLTPHGMVFSPSTDTTGGRVSSHMLITWWRQWREGRVLVHDSNDRNVSEEMKRQYTCEYEGYFSECKVHVYWRNETSVHFWTRGILYGMHSYTKESLTHVRVGKLTTRFICTPSLNMSPWWLQMVCPIPLTKHYHPYKEH